MLRRTVQRYGLSPPDVADVVQVTWLRLTEHIAQVRDADRLRGWLATTARRECLVLLRRGRRTLPLDQFDVASDERDQPDRIVEAASERDMVRAALRRLPHHQERLLRALMAGPQPSYREVARTLGIPHGSIGPTRRRALSQLRRDLAAAG
jgi:RNA polymerase sigma factor (sigma-70 family)